MVERIRRRKTDIMETASKRPLTPDELLQLMSRSFYPGILLLQELRGLSEHDKKAYVGCAYNILRELDTIEDSSLSVQDKVMLFDIFVRIIDKIAQRSKGGNIDDLITRSLPAHEENMEFITDILKKGVRSDEERIFVEHFGRGVVLRELNGFDKDVRDGINYCTGRMTFGMKGFLERGKIETTPQLREYCFSVAGSIGEFLTNLVNSKDAAILRDRRLDEGLAQKFGEFLQLTNIAKNVREDADAGRAFFPEQYRLDTMSPKDFVYGKGDDAKEARKCSLGSVLGLAKDNLEDSVRYVTSIPEELSGYKVFCLFPLVIAAKTIETMDNAGAERVFAGGKSAIKIQHGNNILDFCRGIVTHCVGVNANLWLSEYAQNPVAFSFEDKLYKKWSPDWLERIKEKKD